MLEKDNSASVINAEVNACKSATRLDPESQSPEYSGHESADYNSGPDKSTAGPKGVGATGY